MTYQIYAPPTAPETISFSPTMTAYHAALEFKFKDSSGAVKTVYFGVATSLGTSIDPNMIEDQLQAIFGAEVSGVEILYQDDSNPSDMYTEYVFRSQWVSVIKRIYTKEYSITEL